jgi:hypothetical protein
LSQYQGKTPLNSRHLNNEGLEGRTGHAGGALVGRRVVKRIKEGKNGHVFLYLYKYGTMKPVEVILRRGRGKRENNGENEPSPGMLYVHMEM